MSCYASANSNIPMMLSESSSVSTESSSVSIPLVGVSLNFDSKDNQTAILTNNSTGTRFKVTVKDVSSLDQLLENPKEFLLSFQELKLLSSFYSSIEIQDSIKAIKVKGTVSEIDCDRLSATIKKYLATTRKLEKMVFKKTTVAKQKPLLELKEAPFSLELKLRKEEEDRKVQDLREVSK